ncbi:MAG: T9SS type A sorting domain-containing protein [Flavobacteriaceae bacterium]
MSLRKFFLSVLFSSTFFASLSQSSAITIDGVFDDWTTTLTTFTDPSETINGVDLLEVQVTNDANFLFLKIKTNTEFELTDDTLTQNIGLYIDTDNNSSTGYNIQTGYGSEIGVIFNQYLAHYNVTPYSQISFSDFSLRVAPTVSSNEFEIAIKRDAIPDGSNPLFSSNTIKIVLKNLENSDNLPNNGTVFSYTFDNTPVAPLVPIEINKDNANLIRIVSYNTLFDGLIDPNRVARFQNIITVLNPDIISLLESWNTNPNDIKLLFDAWLPLGTQDGWYVVKNSSAIIVSKWAYLDQWDYLDRQFPVLIDLPNTYSTNLLLTAAHLKCCSNGDALRQSQADEYANFIVDAKTPGSQIDLPQNTPFVYTGDLNLVGSSSPLTTLVTGLDWDNSNLTDENAIQTDNRMAYTWRKDNTQYPPGKLDFTIFSDAVMSAQKSFVLQTEIMPTSRLQLYGLDALDTSMASDHFPIVTDFQISQTASLNEASLELSIKLFPNPTSNKTVLKFNDSNNYKIIILNVYGKIIKQFNASNEVEINLSENTNGLYLISITDKNGTTFYRKIIKY